MASHNGVLAGVIDRPLTSGGNEAYVIEPQPDGTSLVMRADNPPQAENDCAAIPVTLPRGGRAPKGDDILPPASPSNPAVIDVMVLYTPASRNRYGASGIQARIIQGIADANTAYQRSQVYITLNLVHVAEVSYTETGNMLDALVSLIGLDDGKLDQVHALRNQNSADLVVLVDEDTNYAGISYMMGTPSVDFAPYAFSVTASGYIPYFTMHHEMGHLMGCNHDHASASGGGSYPYSYGFQRCAMNGTGVRTVMSYPCPSAYASRINYFSNPNVLYNGLPLGIAYESDPVNAADNARSMNQTAHYVASFRSRPSPVPTAPANLAALASQPNLVNLAWTCTSTNETGIKIERASAGVAWAEIASLPAASASYADNGVAASTVYLYRVRAYNSAGASEYSNEVTANTPEPAPESPTSLQATALGANVIALTWVMTTTNATAVRVERAAELGTWTEVAVLPGNATSYTDSTLNPASTYQYRVQACNGMGCSASSTASGATTSPLPPPAPADLHAALLCSTEVSLTWQSPATNLTGYRVECAEAGAAWVEVSALPGTTSSCNQGELKASTTYAFRVRAFNPGGFSPYSEEANITTPEAMPTAPTSLTLVSVGAGTISLTWVDTSTNETAVQVQRSGDLATWVDAATLAANSTVFTDVELEPETTYHYRVQACNASGCSPCSVPAGGTTHPLPPAAPSGLAAVVLGCNAVTLTWECTTANVAGFRVECSASEEAWQETAVLPGNSIGCEQTGLAPCTTYRFRIRAFNAGGLSTYSQELSVSMPEPPPATTTNLTASALSATVIGLAWEDLATNETGWRVERSGDLVNWVEILVLPADSTSCSDTSLAAEQIYHYRVQACNATGCSGYSPTASAATLAAPPSAPQALAVSATDGSLVMLTWQDTSATELGFIIERALDGVEFSPVANVSAGVAAYSDAEIASCQTYYYRVIAWNAGGSSAPSEIASVTPVAGTAPKAPSNPAASALSDSAIKLTWRDNSTDETGFQVENSLDGVNFKVTATLAAKTVAWTNTGLLSGTKYYFRVRALKSCQASLPTTVVSVSTLAPAPAAPSGLAAAPGVAGSRYINLGWIDNASNETAQYLQQSSDGISWKALATLSANVLSYRHSGLTAGKTYYYRIRSYNSAGGYSAFSEVTSAVAQ